MRRRRSCSETDPDLEIYEREWRRVEASEKLPFDPTLPADEHIALQSLWLVDVFLPSRASALLTGLEHLGLRDGSSEGGLSTEIAAARGSAYTASISPIGPFVPSGAAILTQVVREDLPGGVEAAWGWVYQITPAVTVIVWQFTLNDEESHKLEEVFRVHHQGTARRLGPDRITYTSKADVAQRAARGHRAAIRRRCTAWHRAIFDDPGATAAILPGIDLILTDVADPATAAAGRDRGFLRCLDLELFESDQRVCADLPECALHISRDVAHVFTLVAQRNAPPSRRPIASGAVNPRRAGISRSSCTGAPSSPPHCAWARRSREPITRSVCTRTRPRFQIRTASPTRRYLARARTSRLNEINAAMSLSSALRDETNVDWFAARFGSSWRVRPFEQVADAAELQTGPGLPIAPWSNHVHEAIRPALRDAIPDDARYDELFDSFEMILASTGRAWGGRFVWSREHPQQRAAIKESIMAREEGLVRTGFSANTNELEAAIGRLPTRWS